MSKLTRARRAYMRTASFADASAITGVNRKTLQTWALRYGWIHQRHEKLNPKPQPVKSELATKQQFVWCTNIGHETAHLVEPSTGRVACGIDIGRFNRWTIEPEPLRKCLRCPANA